MSRKRHPIDISEADGVRYLHFGDDCVQGAMRIARPWSLELEYTREMLFPLLLQPEPEWPRRCLLVGLGAASQLKFLYRHFPHSHLTAVEIDARVLAIAQQFFKLPEAGSRLELIIADAAEWVETVGDMRFDLILLDGFNARGRPACLDSLTFYDHCRRLLSPQGLLACNLLSRSRGFQASVRRLQQAFAGHCLILPPCGSGNSVGIAGNAALAMDLDAAMARALALQSRTRLDLRPCLARLQADNRL